MTDDALPLNGSRSPQTIREVGYVVEGIRDDVERLDHKVDAYIVMHGDSHKLLQVEVAANTDWRKSRQVYESLMRWVIGTNLVGIIAVIVLLLTYFEGK